MSEPQRFCVGDEVQVLRAAHLPKFEVVAGTGLIERITHTRDGAPLYWVRGFPCGRSADVLRLVRRAS